MKYDMNRALLLIFVVIISSCSSAPEKPNFFGFAKGQKLAELKNPEIEELSGLAPSHRNSGLLWTHNDSGSDPKIYLIDEHLKAKLTCTLSGADNRDWEDITIGPGPDSAKSYLYVGDIGDNLGRFEYKVIYRFEEPALEKNNSEIEIQNFDRLVFRLPDGRKDTETLMIDPLSRDLYLISKRERPVVVYRLSYPQDMNDTLTAERIAEVNLTNIVAGDFSADGKEILIKNIDNVFYWTTEQKKINDVFSKKPKILPYDPEPQGEAITFALDGSGYYTISEMVSGEKSYLLFYKRKDSK
jgi:hypothetical protein